MGGEGWDRGVFTFLAETRWAEKKKLKMSHQHELILHVKMKCQCYGLSVSVCLCKPNVTTKLVMPMIWWDDMTVLMVINPKRGSILHISFEYVLGTNGLVWSLLGLLVAEEFNVWSAMPSKTWMTFLGAARTIVLRYEPDAATLQSCTSAPAYLHLGLSSAS